MNNYVIRLWYRPKRQQTTTFTARLFLISIIDSGIKWHQSVEKRILLLELIWIIIHYSEMYERQRQFHFQTRCVSASIALYAFLNAFQRKNKSSFSSTCFQHYLHFIHELLILFHQLIVRFERKLPITHFIELFYRLDHLHF